VISHKVDSLLIYRRSEGGILSQPMHCSQCAARARSCVSAFTVFRSRNFVTEKKQTTHAAWITNCSHGATRIVSSIVTYRLTLNGRS